MRRLLGRLVSVLAIAASLGLVSQGAAYAAPGGHVLVGAGSGSVSPGLTTAPTFHSGTFSGTFAGAVVAGTNVAVGVLNCNFTFSSSIAETAAQGQGTASGSCSGGTIGAATIVCTVTYIRVGPIVDILLVCVITVGGVTSTSIIGLGIFLFVPTSGNGATSAITNFELAGATTSPGV